MYKMLLGYAAARYAVSFFYTSDLWPPWFWLRVPCGKNVLWERFVFADWFFELGINFAIFRKSRLFRVFFYITTVALLQ